MNEHSKGSAHEPISEVEGIDNNQGNPAPIDGWEAVMIFANFKTPKLGKIKELF